MKDLIEKRKKIRNALTEKIINKILEDPKLYNNYAKSVNGIMLEINENNEISVKNLMFIVNEILMDDKHLYFPN